jgi:hypothetical protein
MTFLMKATVTSIANMLGIETYVPTNNLTDLLIQHCI